MLPASTHVIEAITEEVNNGIIIGRIFNESSDTQSLAHVWETSSIAAVAVVAILVAEVGREALKCCLMNLAAEVGREALKCCLV